MALKHRVVQRFERNGRSVESVRETVRAALNDWLAKPGGLIPAQLGGGLQQVGGGYLASYQRASADGLGEALRWKIITGTAPYVYRSTITVFVATQTDQPSWMWYDVDADREDSRFRPPRLTTLLTHALNGGPRDRISGFTEGLRKVRAEDVGEFLDVVLNDERRVVPAFVSGGRSWSVNDEEHVERALAPLHGIGTFWQLAPEAFDEFNNLVKPGYAVYSGSIHSFQFGLDTEDEQDSRRHWWFSPAEVRQTNAWDLSQRLHSEAMQSSLQVPLPRELAELNPLFDKLETRRLFGQIQVARASHTPGVGQDAPSPPSPKPRPVPSAPKPEPRPRPKPEPRPRNPERGTVGAGTAETVRPSNSATVESAVAATASVTPTVQHPASASVGPEIEAELLQLVENAADEFDLAHLPAGSLPGRLRALFSGIRERVFTAPRNNPNEVALTEIQTQFEELQLERASLQTEIEELSGLLSLADEEAEAQSDILHSQREIAAVEQLRAEHLASELAKLQRATGGAVDWDAPSAALQSDRIDLLDPPTSVDDLLEQVERLSHVVFSGDKKEARRITDLKLRGPILRDVWRFCCELERYARDRAAPSLRDYVESYTTQITRQEFAADETSSVKDNPKFRNPRLLPVPEEVDSSGRVFMGAHFRLSQDNGKAMRMHVYDAVTIDGKIYIGYIGQHLPSRKTS